MSGPLLAIEDLRVSFHGQDARINRAVHGISFSIERQTTLGIVGESGCGKSVTSLAIMGFLPEGSAEISGAVRFDGRDLLKESERALQD
jgi:peptide/nickel transport system ATP-binding protein